MVNHLRTTHYRLGLVCDQCFGCPTVMSDSLHQHGCQIVNNTVLLLDWVCPTDPPAQPRVHTRGVKVVLFNQTPSLQKARRFNKEGATHQPTKSIFYSPSLTDKTAISVPAVTWIAQERCNQ